MRALALTFMVFISIAATASIAPPPPSYIDEARKTLSQATPQDSVYQSLFGQDLIIQKNGSLVARGTVNGIKWINKELFTNKSRLLGYSEYGSDSQGSLLIVSVVDKVNRNALSDTAIADPRLATNSILYIFGVDHRIHQVQILSVDSFYIKQ